jgi:hypothetical protein
LDDKIYMIADATNEHGSQLCYMEISVQWFVNLIV